MKRLLFALALFCSTAHATNAPFLAWYAQDQQGKAMPGAKLYFYGAGGGVAKNVYSDETCAVGTSLGASLTADGAGRFRRFYMGALNDCSSPLLYKVVFKTAGGSTVWTEDNVAALKTDLSGIVAATSNSATAALTGTNTSTGYGVHAISTAGSGHALYVAADTSTPVHSAVHLVPQDATPSTPTKGDFWFDSTTGRIRIYDGTEASELMTQAKAVCAATTAADNGLTCTGNTTGNGVSGTGGATSGAGLYGTGGAPNGNGATLVGTGGGYGGIATGGATAQAGLRGNGTGAGYGVYAQGGATGSGIYASSGAGAATYGIESYGEAAGAYCIGTIGVLAQGEVAGDGVDGTGGPVSGTGVHGTGGTPNGIGLMGTGTGTGYGGYLIASGTGYGAVVEADTTTPARAALRLVPQDADPTGPNLIGDIYISTAGIVHVCTTAGTPGTWTHVGAQ